MNTNLKIAALGIVSFPLLVMVITIVEHGISIRILLKIPGILLAFALSYCLLRGQRWAFTLSVIVLIVMILLTGFATAYIGLTSSLYPLWKILSCLSVVLICFISLMSLLALNRKLAD